MKKEVFNIGGMTCSACQANITRRVEKLDGVQKADVSLLANRMTAEYDEGKINADAIIAAVEEIGYKASINDDGEDNGEYERKTQQKHIVEEKKSLRNRLIASVILLLPLMYVSMGHMLSLPMPWFLDGIQNALISALTQLLLTLPVVFINRVFFTRGIKALFKKSPNMDSLIAVGAGAALLYGIIVIYRMAYSLGQGDMAAVQAYSHELYFESCAMILSLVTVGKYLESLSKSKTTGALDKLIDLAPKSATVIRDGKSVTIPASRIAVGDTVVVRPGEAIAVDGIITDGRGWIDQSSVTGESVPVEKNIGEEVISATINKNGSFRFTATRVGKDTTISQIIKMVEDAGSSKAPIARLADRISGVFVPAVMAVAFTCGLAWVVAGYGFEFALSNAISVLVISCPCALGLATPVAIMVGTGKAAEYGILIKSAQTLEVLCRTDTVVLDKTGTITNGTPEVTDIEVLDGDKEMFAAAAAALESGSEHPLARAVTDYAKKKNIDIPEYTDFEAVSGRGVRARIDGSLYIGGNKAFIDESDVIKDERYIQAQKKSDIYAKSGKTPLIFAREKEVIGVIAVADTIRQTSRDAIAGIKKRGIRTIMLTGDNRVTAEAICREAGVDETVSDVMPKEKEECIRRLQNEGKRVCMVGDGINDAPALMSADVGMAIGAGTDIAIDSADVVLMKNSLEDVLTSIELSRDVVKNIKMNLFWAFFYNVLGIPLACGALYIPFGIRLSPMIGAAAMSLSSVCVVLNALRLRTFRPDSERKNKNNIGDKIMKKTIMIEGMACEHCKANVERALTGICGVESVSVNLENKSAQVTMSGDIEDKVLLDAVTEAGYKPTGIV